MRKCINGRDEKLLIECKHWNDKVNVSTVRELVGVAVGEEILPTGIILATTSEFTPDAKKYKINSFVSIELELRDYEDIIKWVNKYNAIQFKQEEMNRYIFSLGLTNKC